MGQPVIIDVLMACHNRKPATRACLHALYDQVGEQARFRIHLVDDGSTDGTAQMVADEFPEVQLIAGSGRLYWAAAMALAEAHTDPSDPDFYLWLNDDTVLDPECVATMLDVHRSHPAAIVVAATRDPVTGALTYGGRRRRNAHPQRFTPLALADTVTSCDAFNGNCVLVPRAVHEVVGPIDGRFPHAYADDDYSLRATRAGVPILVAPGSLATCSAHPPAEPPRTLRGRWQQMQSPKGLPLYAQVRYLRRHGDWRWPFWLGAGVVRRLLVPR